MGSDWEPIGLERPRVEDGAPVGWYDPRMRLSSTNPRQPRTAPGPLLQRALTAPVLAAAAVALSGLLAHGPFLLLGPAPAVVGLFVAVAAVSSLAAGTLVPRVLPLVAASIALGASATATVLLWRIAALREVAGAPPGLALRWWLLLIAPALFLACIPPALAGSLLRRRIGLR